MPREWQGTMTERIHRVLDGELPREQLTPEEQALLADYEATIAAAGHAIPRYAAPDLSTDVMARIAALDAASAGESTAPQQTASARAPNPARQALSWLWTPRPITFRPAWGLGLAAAALAALLLVPASFDETPLPVATTAPVAAPAEIFVHFRLDAPDARSVHLAGDFTEWEPAVEMHEVQPGIWTVIVPLRAGVHDYAFVIDGERWTPDPLGTPVDDGFGGQNSRLSVLPPERMQV